MKPLFKTILVANRGEIATRIFRAATELGIKTVGIYAYEDRYAIHRYKADQSFLIGKKSEPIQSYLNMDEIIRIALENKVEAIHPGYGFLSENAEFAKKCEQSGLVFIGPGSEILAAMGDKIAAKKLALKNGVKVIPGPVEAIADGTKALLVAINIGFPVMIKAAHGGGGRGIRVIEKEQEFLENFELCSNEAKKAFGNGSIFLEKAISKAKHIEVQIAGDYQGNVYHFFERDCSIQRRNQKILEMAPSRGLSDAVKYSLYKQAVDLGKAIGYVGIGTVEFLVDDVENTYFLEVNPRVQVEHTITEMVTGFDLVQASILLAAGKPFTHSAMQIQNQNEIKCKGYALQSRITTEDPENNFSPSVGMVTTYRVPSGFGVRVDESIGSVGETITPYYDSMIAKVCTWGFDFKAAVSKMNRCLSEFRIRGIKSNIPLLKNIINHPDFGCNRTSTRFMEKRPELFIYPKPKDRASKILRYIGEVCINNLHAVNLQDRSRLSLPEIPVATEKNEIPHNAMKVFKEGGSKALVDWIKNKKNLLVTDTSMRDAHQSLFATRLRSKDILNITEYYNRQANGLFSLEMWGGATFDTCMRFLYEDPWQRLHDVREKAPDILLQMLFRGSNAVGYKHYPQWLIKKFIKEAVEAGLNVFRVFDCLNNLDEMRLAIDEAKSHDVIVEACICYTGDILDKKRTKYDIKYYLEKAEQISKSGADILCIKDMAGLLKPGAARVLIEALKQTCDLPIHLHNHDTSGNGVATILSAALAGCDIVDGAIASMSGLSSQPSLNAICTALEQGQLASDLSLDVLDNLSSYWEGVRGLYNAFDPGLKATTTRVYHHEIPGGQYSNLYDQARKVGLSSSEFSQITERYKEVNELFGDIVKVTPSSKVVGDLALLLQKNGLTGKRLIEEKPLLDYPDSVISFCKGHLGVPYQGIPEDIRKLVLNTEQLIYEKAPIDESKSFEDYKVELMSILKRKVSDQEVISFVLYDKVYLEFVERKETFGGIRHLDTRTFFYGLEVQKEIEIEVEKGVTIYVTLRGISDVDDQGYRTAFFKMNGFPRDIKIQDLANQGVSNKRRKADSGNSKHIGAPMPGKIFKVNCQKGSQVEENQVIIITESMKMEYAIKARARGIVKEICVAEGDQIDAHDLLVLFE